MSNNLNDVQALTTGNFFIGSPLVAPAEPSLSNLPDNCLTHWQFIQTLSQCLWKRLS